MLKPRLKLFKKEYLASFLGLIGIFCLLWYGINNYFTQAKLAPEEILRNTVESTLASKSFRYRVEYRMVNNKKVESISKVEGERVSPDKAHIKGTLLKTPVEIVQIKDTTYMKDPFSGKWQTLHIEKPELLLVELDPLANFNFKNVSDIKYKGEERIEGDRLMVLEIQSGSTDSQMMRKPTSYFYKLWIDPSDYYLRHAIVEGKEVETGKTKVVITLKMWDYNTDISIKPPVAS